MQKNVRTLIDRMRYQAENIPDKIVYRYLNDDNTTQSITFAELEKQVRDIAAKIQEHAAIGERALLLYPSGLNFIKAFLACLATGIIAIPANTPKKNRSIGRLNAILADAQPKLILTTNNIAPVVEAVLSNNPIAPKLVNTDTITTNNRNWQYPNISSDSVAFLQYTSGSTGIPKGVIITNHNLICNEETIKEAFGASSKSILVGWLPLFHDMGLIGNVLGPLYVGLSSVLMSPAAFLREPIKWLRAISDYKGTCAGSPDFGWAHCYKTITEEQKQGLDLSSLKTAYNGAEPVRAETLQKFYKAFAKCGFRKEAFFPCYGMAETTLFISGGPSLTEQHLLEFSKKALENHKLEQPKELTDLKILVGCGRTWLNTEVRIVDPKTTIESKNGVIGEIWVKGGSVAKGYWCRPEETKETFQAYISNSGEGPFLRTGDLGFIKGGEVFITGRVKDLIILHGRNIYPQDIELTLEKTIDFIKPNTCSAFSIEVNNEEHLAAVVEANREIVRYFTKTESDSSEGNINVKAKNLELVDSLVKKLRKAISEEFDTLLHTVIFVKPGAFPRTSSGKVQRSLCRSKLLNGELEVVFSSDLSDGNHTPNKIVKMVSASSTPVKLASTEQIIHDTIVSWLSKGQHITQIDYQTPLTSYGLDSIGVTTIALELEKKTGKQFNLGYFLPGISFYQ